MLIGGCTTTTGQPSLGESVTVTPGWPKLKSSTTQAFLDPNVWSTLLTAALLQIDDLDHEISDQLREDTPLFGSTQDARDASDDFRSLNQIAYISTALLVPGPEDVDEWFGTKAKLIGSEWLTTETAGEFTTRIQPYSDREKPNEKNGNSFPSYHTVTTTTSAQMAKLNVEYMPIGTTSQQALNYTFDGIAALTAWARVEAGEHYPSDVLVGWALGHIFGHLGKAFIVPDQQQLVIRPQLSRNSSGIELQIKF